VGVTKPKVGFLHFDLKKLGIHYMMFLCIFLGLIYQKRDHWSDQNCRWFKYREALEKFNLPWF